MTGVRSEQDDAIAFLGAPETHAGLPVERHETHGAYVFLAGDRAYKLKRAIRYPYMDYSTPERRRQMSFRELEVNRVCAPSLYLEVKPLVRDRGRVRFGSTLEADKAIDWVVVMRRFDQASLLEEMRKSGRLDLAPMRRLGSVIAQFHQRARPAPGFGGSDAIAAVIRENTAQFAAAPRIFAAHEVELLRRSAEAALTAVSPLLDNRRENGFVRRCHGDLHLNNIFMQDDEPVLFDAIEFEDRFSCIDVLYDLAFLLMDLDRHNMRAHANLVLNRYLELTFDFEGLAALPLFLSCRAAIRAHVTASASALAQTPARTIVLADEAKSLLARALDYLEPAEPRIVAIGGVSGTGKSTLAYGLAPRFLPAPGAVVLRSDIFRKHRAQTEETSKLPVEAYTREANAAVYADLDDAAHRVVIAGYSAIVDAVHGRADEQSRIANVACEANVGFSGIWLDAKTDALRPRVEQRRGDASDATVAVLEQQLTSVAAPATWSHIDASGSRLQTLRRTEETLGLSAQ